LVEKDALCVAELGPSYRAALALDVTALQGTRFITPNASTAAFAAFVVADPDVGQTLITTSSINGLTLNLEPGIAAGPVVCVRSSARLQFTRGTVSANAPVAAKDAQCMAERGPDFRAALALDVMTLYRTQFRIPGVPGAFSSFVVADPNVAQSMQVTLSSNAAYLTILIGSEVAPVACALK
jgi:hypothetical protein